MTDNEPTTLTNQELMQMVKELLKAYNDTLAVWVGALDLHYHEASGHTRHVIELSMQLAKRMGLSDPQVMHIRLGALLHDIGKMGVPDQIVSKSGALDKSEWEIMRRHPQYAYDLLGAIEYLRPALDIPYAHHEWWDGSGYPRGLKGEDIPIAARIFAVVDVWDSLISSRSYRKAWQKDDALEYIGTLSGSQFDPAVVKVFLEMHQEGLVWKLSGKYSGPLQQPQ